MLALAQLQSFRPGANRARRGLRWKAARTPLESCACTVHTQLGEHTPERAGSDRLCERKNYPYDRPSGCERVGGWGNDGVSTTMHRPGHRWGATPGRKLGRGWDTGPQPGHRPRHTGTRGGAPARQQAGRSGPRRDTGWRTAGTTGKRAGPPAGPQLGHKPGHQRNHGQDIKPGHPPGHPEGQHKGAGATRHASGKKSPGPPRPSAQLRTLHDFPVGGIHRGLATPTSDIHTNKTFPTARPGLTNNAPTVREPLALPPRLAEYDALFHRQGAVDHVQGVELSGLLVNLARNKRIEATRLQRSGGGMKRFGSAMPSPHSMPACCT